MRRVALYLAVLAPIVAPLSGAARGDDGYPVTVPAGLELRLDAEGAIAAAGLEGAPVQSVAAYADDSLAPIGGHDLGQPDKPVWVVRAVGHFVGTRGLWFGTESPYQSSTAFFVVDDGLGQVTGWGMP